MVGGIMMRTRIFTLIALSAIVAGCAKQAADPSIAEKELIPLTFKTEFVNEDIQVASEAKSYLDPQVDKDGKSYHIVKWHAEDKIAVVPVKSGGNDFIGTLTDENFFITEEGGVEASFSGTSVAADEYVGVYPASGTDFLDVNHGIVYKDLYANQSAVEGNVGINMIPAVTKATAADEKLYFYNACTIIKFTIPTGLNNITKVSFRGGNYEKLAGRIGMKYSEDQGISVWVDGTYKDQDSQYTLTISNPDGSALTEGGTYYMVSAPAKLNNGFTIVMYGSDGKRYITGTSKSNELHRSKVLNLGTLDAEADSPAYENLYMMSSINSWTFDEVPNYSLDPFIFRTGAIFDNGDQFKFGSESGSWENAFKAFEASANPLNSTDVKYVPGINDETDYNWVVNNSVSTAYRIIVDITTGIEKLYMSEFVDYTGIWMYGSATKSGWSMDDADALVKSETEDFIYSWTGDLIAGEIKFTIDKRADFGGRWLMSTANAAKFESGNVLYVNLDEYPGIDYKWNVEAAGNYTITINTLTEKITVVKNEESAE